MSIGRPFLNLTSITFNLKFYRVPNPAFAPNCASVNFWVERCGWRDVEWWRLECRREWGLGRVEGWAGHLQGEIGGGGWEGRGTERDERRRSGRPRVARCADWTPTSGTDTCQKQTQGTNNRRWEHVNRINLRLDRYHCHLSIHG